MASGGGLYGSAAPAQNLGVAVGGHRERNCRRPSECRASRSTRRGSREAMRDVAKRLASSIGALGIPAC